MFYNISTGSVLILAHKMANNLVPEQTLKSHETVLTVYHRYCCYRYSEHIFSDHLIIRLLCNKQPYWTFSSLELIRKQNAMAIPAILIPRFPNLTLWLVKTIPVLSINPVASGKMNITLAANRSRNAKMANVFNAVIPSQ